MTQRRAGAATSQHPAWMRAPSSLSSRTGSGSERSLAGLAPELLKL